METVNQGCALLNIEANRLPSGKSWTDIKVILRELFGLDISPLAQTQLQDQHIQKPEEHKHNNRNHTVELWPRIKIYKQRGNEQVSISVRHMDFDTFNIFLIHWKIKQKIQYMTNSHCSPYLLHDRKLFQHRR